MVEKVKNTYWFSEKYENEEVLENKDYEVEMKVAKVVLEIDHRHKTFSIIPYCGTTDYGFMFKVSSHKWRMWKAITNCINEAIDFANMEIGIFKK